MLHFVYLFIKMCGHHVFNVIQYLVSYACISMKKVLTTSIKIKGSAFCALGKSVWIESILFYYSLNFLELGKNFSTTDEYTKGVWEFRQVENMEQSSCFLECVIIVNFYKNNNLLVFVSRCVLLFLSKTQHK